MVSTGGEGGTKSCWRKNLEADLSYRWANLPGPVDPPLFGTGFILPNR